MSEARTRTDLKTKTIFVEAEFGGENDMRAILEGVKTQIVDKIVSMYVDTFAEEIITSIDLETIKKKTNEAVTVEAIKKLISD